MRRRGIVLAVAVLTWICVCGAIFASIRSMPVREVEVWKGTPEGFAKLRGQRVVRRVVAARPPCAVPDCSYDDTMKSVVPAGDDENLGRLLWSSYAPSNGSSIKPDPAFHGSGK